ncbi:XRE family transcriptional regulator [Antrihabitans stalactiti]|uniref:Helix-turn-helix transcriptional regulator n=1 Tax=Antrihabitans stalactiti TaxID=2584121 RepID=A0A848KH90_9NOCA|nr:XRE family transcriptional regulator [Antrihabitans stalactiti]NMN95560.1 helix-turn-helix transcriptional regulator [Antrihabitans stalactiti]
MAAQTSDPEPAAAVGLRIRAVRKAQRMTIESLAEASGLTKSFLSKVERGRSTASVAALLRVSEALGIPLSNLFETSTTRSVIRAGEYPAISFGGHALSEYLLTPQSERRIQVLLSKIAPGGGSGSEPYPLPGEVEFVFVVEGVLEVRFADGVVTLGSGDALTFDPASPRAFLVPTSAPTTTVLWMICPALPHTARR